MEDVDQQHPAMIDEEIYFHQLKNQLPAAADGADGGRMDTQTVLDPHLLGAVRRMVLTQSGVLNDGRAHLWVRILRGHLLGCLLS